MNFVIFHEQSARFQRVAAKMTRFAGGIHWAVLLPLLMFVLHVSWTSFLLLAGVTTALYATARNGGMTHAAAMRVLRGHDRLIVAL